VKSTVVPATVMIVGLLLMGSSLVWARAVSQRGTWTDEQAETLRELKKEAHALHYAYQGALARKGAGGDQAVAHGHQHEGVEVPDNLDELKAKLDAVLARHDRLSVQLDAARGGGLSLASLSWWTGIGLCGLGVAVHFICKTAWARAKLGEA
jgi:hypothetical protein